MFFRFLCHLEHGFVALVSCWRDRTARTASSTAVFRYIMEHFGDEVAKAVGWRQGQGMAKERALIKSLNYILRSERERETSLHHHFAVDIKPLRLCNSLHYAALPKQRSQFADELPASYQRFAHWFCLS